MTSRDLICWIASVRALAALSCCVSYADCFHRSGGGLRRDGVVVSQGDVRGSVGIDLVGLAPHASYLPGRADYLDDLKILATQMARQARAVRAGAFDADAQ